MLHFGDRATLFVLFDRNGLRLGHHGVRAVVIVQLSNSMSAMDALQDYLGGMALFIR